MTAPPKLAPRIVIVDDHPNTASMLARAMAQFNRPMEVLTARGGQEALEVIGEQPVDVLITDFMMPGMNGLELIEKLQKSREPAHVILVTAYDSPGLAATARRLKVGHYLVKPVQPDKIREIVSKILESGAPAARAQIADMPPPSSFKILIADDQPDNVRLLATRLEAEGYAFITAADGDESLSKVYSERPDLLLLDVNMPKKSGFEVLAEMRGDPEVAHIPVIILTAARISPRDVREGLTLGADDYITKPFDWRDLAARLRSKLRVKHAEDVLRRRNRELSLLPEIGQDLTARLDVEELADVVLQRAVETLDAASGHLLVFPPEGKIFSKDFSVRRIGGWAWSELQDQLMATGLIGYVLEQRAGAFLADAQTADHWPHLEDDAVRAAISVPLLSRHGAIGALTLVHEAAGHFNADHITLLQAIASQAAIAIENAQLVAIERKRVGELVALNQITREISLFTHSAEMFDRLPLLIRENLNYPAVTLWLVEPDGMSLRAQSGMEDAPRPSILALAPTQVVETGKPANLSGSVEERTGARAGVGVPPMHSTVAVPLFWEARVSGVLAIHSRQPHAFQESERVLLETLAAQMVSALERIRLFESVEQEQQRMAAVLRSAADAILVLDERGRLQIINPAAQRLFTDIETQLGKPLPRGRGYDDLVHMLDQTRANGAMAHNELPWPDGRTFTIFVTPIEDGGQVSLLHDVTRFKELEKMKNELLATATHDLKNPLTAISGYSDLLLKIGQLTPQQADFIGRIQTAAKQMFELVQDLLEMARLEMGLELKKALLDGRDMLAEICDEFGGQAATKQQTLTFEPIAAPLPINVDAGRLRQVLRNLVGNAVKYTPEGGQITVSARVEARTVRMLVRDTGVGIPPDDLPFIFDKFFRVKSAETRDIEGSGLGLAIVKTIVDQHGGQISVESTPGTGSCFTVSLPLN